MLYAQVTAPNVNFRPMHSHPHYEIMFVLEGEGSLITEKGEIQDALPPLVTGYTAHEVSTYTHTTLYTVIGNLIVLLSFGYLALLQVLRVADVVKIHREDQA